MPVEVAAGVGCLDVRSSAPSGKIPAAGFVLLVPGDGNSALTETHPEWVFERRPIFAAALEGDTASTLVELPPLRRWYGTRGGHSGPIQVKGRAGNVWLSRCRPPGGSPRGTAIPGP